ncbi:hypothetical protein MTR67_004101 [Solanum verrucosum]|uniref:Uncharacterized protein n=1 Tax=Solanum verrucosum TaxID=315347 RepID=A0AAF0T9X8_SOLVR|nr:hypothetical protein MTR67_004101 [Solanum verrucosum]
MWSATTTQGLVCLSPQVVSSRGFISTRKPSYQASAEQSILLLKAILHRSFSLDLLDPFVVCNSSFVISIPVKGLLIKPPAAVFTAFVETSRHLHDLKLFPLLIEASENLLQSHKRASLLRTIFLTESLVVSTHSYHSPVANEDVISYALPPIRKAMLFSILEERKDGGSRSKKKEGTAPIVEGSLAFSCICFCPIRERNSRDLDFDLNFLEIGVHDLMFTDDFMMFRYDTVIFCDAKAEQVCFIRIILVIFEAVSGLSVNWRKSSMFQVKEVANVQCLANILSCKIENLPTTYLGMPLGNNHKELEIWDGIVEKTEKKLATWKTQYLSLGGRITMINSVLDALPTYVMSLFPLPAKVEDRLDKLRRDFLWLGNKEGKGIHLVKWQTAQLSKKSGGLGIKNLGLQNRCLLSKWLWRFGKEGQALWKDVIVSKYGQTDSWTSNTVTSTYGVSVWRSIRNLWPELARNICYKVGEGTRILFWKDKWIGQNSLMEDFADLYSFCDNPGESIVEMWSQQGWNITLRRLLNDWEVDRVANLLQRLEDFLGLNTNPMQSDGNMIGMGNFLLEECTKETWQHTRGAFLDLGNKFGNPTPQPR